MTRPRTVLVLGDDAASLLGSEAPAFRDVLACDGALADVLAEVARDLGGGAPGAPAPDALRLLALIDLDREHRKGHNRRAVDEARRALIRLGIDAERRAAGGSTAEALAACLAPGDAVVSLGPEERLEAALRRQSWPAWSPSDGYGLAFRRPPRAASRSNVRVHKLRGSLGWVHCRRCRALYSASPVGTAPDGGGHPCVHADDDRETVVAGRGLRGQPRSVLRGVRAAAAASLARADRVVLVGEAPDDGDPFVLWVLRRGAGSRRRESGVVAAGPRAAEEGARLRALLRIEAGGSDIECVRDLPAHLGRPGSLF